MQVEVPRVEVIDHKSVKFIISYKNKSVSFVVNKNTREMKDFVVDGLEVRLFGYRNIMNVLSRDKNERLTIVSSEDFEYKFSFVIDVDFQFVSGDVDYSYRRIYSTKSARKLLD